MAGRDRLGAKPGRVPAGALVRRIGTELERLSALTAEVQDAITQVGPGHAPPAGAIRRMQHIDLVTQSLGDLGRLLAALADELPEKTGVRSAPLLATLRLRNLDSIVMTVGTDAPSAPGLSEDSFWL